MALNKSPKEAKDAKDKAEATFKRKQEQAREGAIAMAEYQAAVIATREKTARLRKLRLAREAAERKAKAKPKPPPAKSQPSRKKTRR